MTNVEKPSEATAAPPALGAEKPGTEPKPGEFDRLLDSRKDTGRESRTEGSSGRTDASRDAAAGASLVHERHERRDHEGGGSGEGQGQDREGQAALRALPGDVAMATPIRWEPAPAAAAPARAAEMAARIEHIAQQIVQSAEVTLGPGGTTEARLSLDLGSLGSVNVSLAKGEDGALRVSFQAASAEATSALTTNATDLLGRLESRGLVVHDITVKGTDQADFRLAGAASASHAEAEAQRQRDFEDGRRRRRPPEVEAAEDE